MSITYGFTNPMPDTDEGPWKVTAKDIVDGKIDYSTARKTSLEEYEKLTAKSKPDVGDVLLTKDGTLGRVAIVDQEGICINQSVATIKCNERIIPKFLYSILQMPEYQEKMLADAGGVTVRHLYITRVDKMPVCIPSFSEQHKWLHFIEQSDKSKFDDSEYLTLEQCCTSVTGGNTPSMKHDEYYGGDIPFIKSGDVKDAYVSAGALWLTQEALEKTTAKYVPKGTVIVVVRSGILKHDLPVAIAANPVVINQDLKAFQPRPEFTSQYLAWAIKSKEDYLLRMTRAMTVDNIESKELFSIPVMVAPLEQQKYFEHFVEQIDKSK